MHELIVPELDNSVKSSVSGKLIWSKLMQVMNEERKIRLPLHEYELELADRNWSILHAGLMLTNPDELGYFEHPLPYGIALWPASIALAYAIFARANNLQGKRVLELGAGTGLPGLVAAHLEASVVQTDCDEMAIWLSRLNAENNQIAKIDLRRVDWNNWTDQSQYDYIVGSDILYSQDLHAAILNIFETNLAHHGHILLADPLRDSSRLFLQTLVDSGWDLQTECWQIDQEEDSRAIGVFDLTRKCENA